MARLTLDKTPLHMLTARALWAQGVTPARVAVAMEATARPDLAGTNWPISGDTLTTATPPYTPSAGTLWGAPGVSGYGFPQGVAA